MSQPCQRQHANKKVFRGLFSAAETKPNQELSPIVSKRREQKQKSYSFSPLVASFMRVSTDTAERCISNRRGGGGGEKDRRTGGRDADGYSFRLRLSAPSPFGYRNHKAPRATVLALYRVFQNFLALERRRPSQQRREAMPVRSRGCTGIHMRTGTHAQSAVR